MVTTKVLKEVWIEDNDDFFKGFSPVGQYSFLFSNFVFRGERSNSFKNLLPTSLREDSKSIKNLYGLAQLAGMDSSHPQHMFESFYQSAELNILKNFYTTANNKGLNLPDVPFFRKYSLNNFLTIDLLRYEIGDKWLPDDFLEVAALAQHYGLPTRLIDWSKDIYTSLYFASVGALHNEDATEYMILYALDYTTVEFLKNTTSRIPLRLVVPEQHKNPNLNYQRGILSAWEYGTAYIQDLIISNTSGIPEDLGFPLVSYKSLDVLMQEYVDKNNISWGGIGVIEQEPLMYKFYIPIDMSIRIYDYLLKIGYGADRMFTGFDGISQMMKDNMAYNQKSLKMNHI